jgi:3D (Asp-Asp-Asp) domain-containing protein
MKTGVLLATLLLPLLLASCVRHHPIRPGQTGAATPPPAEPPPPEPAQEPGIDPLLQQALDFTLPAPEGEGTRVEDLWSTHYHLWEATEVDADEGFVVLDPDDQPFPADEPLHLSGRDWCYTALEGSGHVERLDGSSITINYAAQGEVAVPCEQFLGERWRSQGRVRFGLARGPYGDGVAGYVLVPFRTLAVDQDQATIPYGAAVFVPAAVGQPFDHEGRRYLHDGWFFAADTGGAIRDHHLDTFTGATADNTLGHVLSSPDAQRFEARIQAADGAVGRLLETMHRDPELWHDR